MPNRVEEFASKVVGSVKSAKAAFQGLSGVFRQLTREHGEVTALLMRVKASSNADVQRELFPTIRRELLSHEQGELKEVYPVFRRHPELALMAERHDAQAGELQRALDDLTSGPYGDPSWSNKFAQLVDLVSRHTKLEEEEFFPVANHVLGKAEAERLERRYEGAKAEAMRLMQT